MRRASLSSSARVAKSSIYYCKYYILGNLPKYVIHAACSILLVIKNTLDHFVISFINFKIQLVLQEKEVIEIIELARGTNVL